MKFFSLPIISLICFLWSISACMKVDDEQYINEKGDAGANADKNTDGGLDKQADSGGGLKVVWATVFDYARSFDIWTVKMDSSGNLVIAGRVTQDHILIAKYNKKGEQMWIREFGNGQVWVRSLTMDINDNIILAGDFSGVLDFGGETLLNKDHRRTAMFIAKLAPDGSHLYSRMANGQHCALAEALSIRPDGRIVLGGTVSGVWEMDDHWLFSFDRRSYVLMTFAPDLSLEKLWKHEELDSCASLDAMEITDEGQVVVAGSGCGPLQLGDVAVYGTEKYFLFVARFDVDGVLLWQRRFDVGSMSSVADLKVGSDGDIYLTGNFEKSVNFGGGVIENLFIFDDAFLVKLNRNGEHQWSRGFGDEGLGVEKFGDEGFVGGVDLALDEDNNVFMTGRFSGYVDFGGALMRNALGNFGDAFITQYNSDGALLLRQGFGSADNDTNGKGIWVLDGGDILNIGYFHNTLQMGNITLHDNKIEGAAYIARFEIDPQYQSDTYPFFPNTGDVQEKILSERYISAELNDADDFCNYDPIAQDKDNMTFCDVMEPNPEIDFGVEATMEEICKADTTTVISNNSVETNLIGEPNQWGTGLIRVSFPSKQIFAAVYNTPVVDVVDSSFNVLSITKPDNMTKLTNGVEYTLNWSNDFPCDYYYEAAIKVSFGVKCSDGIVNVDAYSTHTWCRSDDACNSYGWLGEGESCYVIGHILID